MDIKPLLLPREEYAEKSQHYGRAPFTFEIHNSARILHYFGANHSPDPNNAQYPALRKYWQRFLKETEDRERVVLVENRLRPLFGNEQEAILNSSEGGFITFLAHQAGVVVECPDMSKSEFLALTPSFNRELFLLHSFLAWVDQYQSIGKLAQNAEVAIEKWCVGQRERAEWKGIDINAQNLTRLYKEVTGKDFDPLANHNHLLDPNKKSTSLNRIVREYSDAREEKIVREIVRHWQENKNIFIVFGSGHLIIERPALEILLS